MWLAGWELYPIILKFFVNAENKFIAALQET
jgi:hypothetical protein